MRIPNIRQKQLFSPLCSSYRFFFFSASSAPVVAMNSFIWREFKALFGSVFSQLFLLVFLLRSKKARILKIFFTVLGFFAYFIL